MKNQVMPMSDFLRKLPIPKINKLSEYQKEETKDSEGKNMNFRDATYICRLCANNFKYPSEYVNDTENGVEIYVFSERIIRCSSSFLT